MNQGSSPAQFVLLNSHSVKNIMQCKEYLFYIISYASCQAWETKKYLKIVSMSMCCRITVFVKQQLEDCSDQGLDEKQLREKCKGKVITYQL